MPSILSLRIFTSRPYSRLRFFIKMQIESAIPPSIRLFEEILSLLVNSRKKWYQPILQKVQNLVPHDYIKSCTTVYNVVQQYVLVITVVFV